MQQYIWDKYYDFNVDYDSNEQKFIWTVKKSDEFHVRVYEVNHLIFRKPYHLKKHDEMNLNWYVFIAISVSV